MTNGNHPTAERSKMVRFDFHMPSDLYEEISRRARQYPELTRADITRRLLRAGLAAEAAA